MYVADQYRVPMREMLKLNIESFGRRPSLWRYHDRAARREITSKIQAKSGKRFIFPLPSGYVKAGTGPNIKRTSAYQLWATATFDGQYNVAQDIGLNDLTYETSVGAFKDQFSDGVGEAFANILDERFAEGLTEAQWMVVFNPADPGRSMQQVASKFRRYGIMGTGAKKPNLAVSDNVMDSLDYYKANAVREDSVASFSNKFNVVESNQDIPDYLTGDRAGLCPVVYGGCQSGCKIIVDFGADGANRLVAYAGEVIEFEGVQGIIVRTQKRTGQRQQFRVERDIWTDSNGLASVLIYDHLRPQNQSAIIGENHYGQDIHTDAHANATQSPDDGARVHISPGLKANTRYEQSIAWMDNMITLVTPPAAKGALMGAERMAIRVKEGGSISDLANLVYSVSLDTDHGPTETHRLDMHLDVLTKQRELGVRLVGPELGAI